MHSGSVWLAEGGAGRNLKEEDDDDDDVVDDDIKGDDDDDDDDYHDYDEDNDDNDDDDNGFPGLQLVAQERCALHADLPDLPLHLPMDIQVQIIKMTMIMMVVIFVIAMKISAMPQNLLILHTTIFQNGDCKQRG